MHKVKKGKGDSESNGGPPDIELPCNPSEFAVFASVRRSVLEAWAGKATQIYLAATGVNNTEVFDPESDSDATEIWHPPPPRLPKVCSSRREFTIFSCQDVLRRVRKQIYVVTVAHILSHISHPAYL